MWHGCSMYIPRPVGSLNTSRATKQTASAARNAISNPTNHAESFTTPTAFGCPPSVALPAHTSRDETDWWGTAERSHTRHGNAEMRKRSGTSTAWVASHSAT